MLKALSRTLYCLLLSLLLLNKRKQLFIYDVSDFLRMEPSLDGTVTQSDTDLKQTRFRCECIMSHKYL